MSEFPTDPVELRKAMRNGTLPKYQGPDRNGPPGTPESSQQHPKTPAKRRSTGRFQTLNQFCDESARSVSTTTAAVWFVLYRNTRTDGTARLSHNQIAEWLGISRRTAMRSVSELVDAKLAQVISRGHAEGATPSTYKVFGRPPSE